MGATAGRTTLTGEGLQHDDGHTHIQASTIPNLRAYDPAFAYELAAVVRDGIERMYGAKPEDVFYYISIYNENYAQPVRPDGLTDEALLRGIYRFAAAPDVGKGAHAARLVGSGSILQQVLAARDLLAEKFGVAAEVYSAPSFPLLRRDALEAERWNRLHPDAKTPRVPVRQHDPAAGRWADRRGHGLDEGVAGHGRALAAVRLRRPRDRRLRPERHPREPARAVRDRPGAHRGGHDGLAGAHGRHPGRRRPPRRSRSSASTRTRPIRWPSSSIMTDTPAGSTITVSGTGRVAVEPDVADLRMGVSIARPTVDTARADAAAAMTAILAAIRAAGVVDRDIRTTLVSVQPRYDYRDGKPPVLTGYELSNVVEVTIRDLAGLGNVIDGSLTAGATSMDGLSFRVDEPADAERAARLAAMAQARSRADVLAEAAGVAITGVSEVVEGGGGSPGYPQAKAARMMMSDAATPVEGGTTEISVSVTVTYQIA